MSLIWLQINHNFSVEFYNAESFILTKGRLVLRTEIVGRKSANSGQLTPPPPPPQRSTVSNV